MTALTGAEGLAEPFAAALAGALSRRGLAPLAIRGREPAEATARAAGAAASVGVSDLLGFLLGTRKALAEKGRPSVTRRSARAPWSPWNW